MASCRLGSTLLSAGNVAAYQPQLAAIGAALAPGGDLLLYGCDVAQSSAGDAFLGDLAAAAGVANIAAPRTSSVPRRTAAASTSTSISAPPRLLPARSRRRPSPPIPTCSASRQIWFGILPSSSTNSDTGVYTVDVNGGAAATNPTDIESTPAYGFVVLDGLAIDPVDGHYFVANYFVNGQGNDVNQIIEGNANGSGTPSVIYTSGNSGEDAIVGLAFDQVNDLIYMAVTDANIPNTNTDTGIYTISALGTGTRTATELVILEQRHSSAERHRHRHHAQSTVLHRRRHRPEPVSRKSGWPT